MPTAKDLVIKRKPLSNENLRLQEATFDYRLSDFKINRFVIRGFQPAVVKKKHLMEASIFSEDVLSSAIIEVNKILLTCSSDFKASRKQMEEGHT